MNTVKISARLLSGPIIDLLKINEQLKEMGLPPYFLGGGGFNVEYRVAEKPRYIWSWSPLGMRLSEVYLYYMPRIMPGAEPTKDDEITVKLC